MIAGTSNNLIKIHDYVLSMGYKTINPDDWHNFMYRSTVNRCDMFLKVSNSLYKSDLRFYIIQTYGGKFEQDFDIITRDEVFKIFDTVRPDLKYNKRFISVSFDEANWEGIKAAISNNKRYIKEMIINDKIETIKTDFV